MVTPTVVPNWLMQRAHLTPQRTALVFHDESWTFKEVFDHVLEIAGKLTSIPVTRQSRVAILLTNQPETVWLIHALQQLGVETVFLNHRLTTNELLFQVKDSEVEVVFFDSKFHLTMKEITQQLSHIRTFSTEHLMELPVAFIDIQDEVVLDDVCSIMYTSGTTGKPKGVLQTYGNHWWSAIGSILNLGLQSNDSWLCTMPLFHISGLSILMRSVIYGIPVYLLEKFDEEAVNQLLKSGKITLMSVVSATLSRMLASLKHHSYHPHLRSILLGGGPAPKPLLTLCKEKGIPVFQTYGMTETASQIVTLSPEDSLTKLGSAGKPLFPCQLKIRGDEGEARSNEVGEIVVKGPNVAKGYLNRDKDNEQSFNNGWFSTGDIGYVDDEGYLYVLDRRSDLIISGGENVYPAEIEGVLASHPAVLEAGVIGVSNEKWGQVPYGFVVVKDAVSEKELQTFCTKQLANYKVPKRIIQLERLPRNGAGKLLRRDLIHHLPEKNKGAVP